MRFLGTVARGAVAAAALLVAQNASAISDTYEFTSGSAVVTVFDVNPDGTLAAIGGPITLTLNGVQVTVDEAAGLLVDVDLTTLGPWVLAVDPTRTGGFDTIAIDDASLTASGGSLSLFDPGPPRGYDYAIGPVTVDSNITASGALIPVPVELALTAISPTATGTIFIDGSGYGALLSMDGITIAELISPLSGGRTVVKADFVFEGRNPVPEPHAMALFALGGAILVFATRKSLLRN